MSKVFTSGESERRTAALSVLKRDGVRREFSLTCVIIIEEGAVKVKVGIGKTIYLKAGKAGENGVQTPEEKRQYILIVTYEQ